MRIGNTWVRRAALIGAGGAATWLAASLMQGAACAKTRQTAPAAPVAIALSTRPPKGAIVLYSGKAADLNNNWYERYTDNPPAWKVDSAGVATPNKKDIVTKQEFGDCYVHVEFAEPVDATGKTIGDGNSGVGLQGRYEVQILDSYGKPPDDTSCASFYSEKPPMLTASRKPGEWQTYDIIFRAPRLNANGEVVEKPRATVFQNGILVQNNEEFTGPTGIQYGQYHEMPKTGPLVLQGDHDPVHFRNVWIVPL